MISAFHRTPVAVDRTNPAFSWSDVCVIQCRKSSRSSVLADIPKAESNAKFWKKQKTKASHKSNLQRIFSPVDGVVTQHAVNTIGSVGEPGKPVKIIGPSGGTVVADVKVPNREMGFVHVCQDVALKFKAYPITRYRTLIGTLEVINADAMEAESFGLVYPAIIHIEQGLGRAGTLDSNPKCKKY